MIETMKVFTPQKNMSNINKIQFDTLDNYHKLAKKLIFREISQHNTHLACKFQNSDDIITNIAHVIMMADWQWNGKGTLEGYRKQRVRWAIKTALTKYHQKRFNTVSLQTDTNTIPDKKSNDPIYNLNQKENVEFINKILNTTDLSTRQKDLIKLKYLNGETFQIIGQKYNISRQRVEQIIKQAFIKIRNKYPSELKNVY